MSVGPLFKTAQWIGMVMVSLLLLLLAGPVLAGPVDWREVPSSSEGQQWWDAGSVRRSKDGTVSVLSRYSLRTEDESPALGTLVVMDIDCDQRLYRDTQKNGLPRLRASWEAPADDDLISEVIDAVCSSGLA